jgi:hypothetical protein
MTHITISRPRFGPRTIGLAGLLALSLALCGTLANTASASLGSLKRISASSATDSSSVKSVTAYCPYRTRVIGTAARITDGGGQVLLEDIAPNAQLTSVTVTAHEDADGWNANWYVTATAICGTATGLELVSNSQSSGVWSNLEVSVYCPNGKQYLSFGLAASGPLEHGTSIGAMTMLTQPYRPYLALDNRSGGPVYMTGYAICADPVPGWELVSAVSPTDSAPTGGKNMTAFCPGGKHVLGSGFQINNVYAGEVNAVGLGPINPLTESNTVTALEEQAGYPNDWSVVSQAICAST